MIARIHGLLESIDKNLATIRVGDPAISGFAYEVMLPAFAVARLGDSIGKPVTLHTFHYLESEGQGSSMLPRLAGFLSPQDREFYLLFTTCKGIGYKRALRALAMDTGQIAAAIADRDASFLQNLPEIGKRMAETIIVTLKGKTDSFVSAATYGAGAAGGVKGASIGAGAEAGLRAPAGLGLIARETMEALLALGENRAQVVQWIDMVLRDTDNPPRDSAELIARVYRIKAGAG